MDLKEISWQVDEPTYRADKALSYSTLAKFEREGFNGLPSLYDSLETPSLTFGSAVDCWMTDGKEEFDKRYIVAEFPSIPDSIVTIVKDLFREFNITHNSLASIPSVEILKSIETFNYQPRWNVDTKINKIKTEGKQYYDLLLLCNGRTLLNTEDFNDIQNSISVLKNSPTTEYYFKANNVFDPNIQRYYQLKFKATLDDIDFRCMADLIIVDYEKKQIQPIDLKTSSHKEWDFYKSFIQWNYQIQARLYWRIIRDNLDRNPYFKDFTLLDYKFIVVNKKTLTPLVWNCQFTQAFGTLTFGENKQIKLRDPYEIAKELNRYLNEVHTVPIGITKEQVGNNLSGWLNTL